MKRLAILLSLFCAAPGFAADLVVTVEGLRSDSGDIRAGIFNSADVWPEAAHTFRRVQAQATLPATVLTFTDLPPGTYAVALYHDENRNGKHDKNFLGIPQEGYGFTRNPTVVLSAPDYEECVIEVSEAGARTTIRIKY
jgi:uncharacterized protein (DUF2141 family)